MDMHDAGIDHYVSLARRQKDSKSAIEWLDGAARAIPRVTIFCLSFIAIALWGNIVIELSRFF